MLFKAIVEGFLRDVWAGGGAELGINQRSKNRLPGTRTSAIPDKSKRIFSRTTNHSGELIYPLSKICGWDGMCGLLWGGVVRGFFGQNSLRIHRNQIETLFNYANTFL